MATSGDYRNYEEIGGRGYSHIIDPRSGAPIHNGVVSTSVIAPTAPSPQQQNFLLAEQHYRKALEIDPHFAPAAKNLAFLILKKPDGDINEALCLARKAKEVAPGKYGVKENTGSKLD